MGSPTYEISRSPTTSCGTPRVFCSSPGYSSTADAATQGVAVNKMSPDINPGNGAEGQNVPHRRRPGKFVIDHNTIVGTNTRWSTRTGRRQSPALSIPITSRCTAPTESWGRRASRPVLDRLVPSRQHHHLQRARGRCRILVPQTQFVPDRRAVECIVRESECEQLSAALVERVLCRRGWRQCARGELHHTTTRPSPGLLRPLHLPWSNHHRHRTTWPRSAIPAVPMPARRGRTSRWTGLGLPTLMARWRAMPGPSATESSSMRPTPRR